MLELELYIHRMSRPLRATEIWKSDRVFPDLRGMIISFHSDKFSSLGTKDRHIALSLIFIHNISNPNPINNINITCVFSCRRSPTIARFNECFQIQIFCSEFTDPFFFNEFSLRRQ